MLKNAVWSSLEDDSAETERKMVSRERECAVCRQHERPPAERVDGPLGSVHHQRDLRSYKSPYASQP